MFKKTILDNGLTIITDNDNNSKIGTLSYLVKSGSHSEDDSNYGIAHFTEHMLFKGTTNRHFTDINQDIENIGGLLNAETSFQYTRYYCVVPSDVWEMGLDVISDIVWNNTIPEEEFENEKTVVLEELKMYSDDSSSNVMDKLNVIMNKQYENRQLVGGTVESVSKITRDQMIDFIDKNYTYDNVVFVGTGNVDHDKIVEFITQYTKIDMSNIDKKDNLEFNPYENSGDEIILSKGEIYQAHIAFGLFGPTPSNDDYVAFEVLNNILGGNSSSLLYHEIRETLGLAYTVSTNIELFDDCTQLIGYVGLDKENIQKCKDVIIQFIEKLSKEKIDDDRLKRNINYLKGTTLLALEKTSSLNSYISQSLVYNVDYNIEKYLENLDKITSNDILNVASKYLNKDKIYFAIIQPK